MSTLHAVDPNDAQGNAQELLGQFVQTLGRAPMMVRVMANSPAILGAYMNFNHASEQLRSPVSLRTLIAAAVSQALKGEYVLSVAAALGQKEGVSTEEIDAARHAQSNDPRVALVLDFAREIADKKGQIDPQKIDALHQAGYDDEEIVEFTGLVALNVFRNYFNLVAQTEVDFPHVKIDDPLSKPASEF